jgi:DNA-binding response OmpR family regulator
MTESDLRAMMGTNRRLRAVTDVTTHLDPTHAGKRILVVDDDVDIASLVEEFLTEEGYAVSLLHGRALEGVEEAVERLHPDCVLLDGYFRGSFAASWAEAAWMSAQDAAVPVIMFSADRYATDEANRNESDRSHAAGFSSILLKPFNLDTLLQMVEVAVTHSPFQVSHPRARSVA